MRKRQKPQPNPSKNFIDLICALYDDHYDDRKEDSAPGGADWTPGVTAEHKSLEAFRRELEDRDISLSTAKIRKILITGGLWSTATSREIKKQYEKLKSIKLVAEKLEVSTALVTMYLPYEKVVYDLEEKSSGAKRVQRWREKRGTPNSIK